MENQQASEKQNVGLHPWIPNASARLLRKAEELHTSRVLHTNGTRKKQGKRAAKVQPLAIADWTEQRTTEETIFFKAFYAYLNKAPQCGAFLFAGKYSTTKKILQPQSRVSFPFSQSFFICAKNNKREHVNNSVSRPAAAKRFGEVAVQTNRIIVYIYQNILCYE